MHRLTAIFVLPRLLFAALLFASLSRLLAANSNSRGVVNADPIVLPPFVVETERVDFNTWIKAISANYVIYTDQEANDAKVMIRDVEMLRAASQQLMGRPFLKSDRTIFVLPGRNSDWTKLELKMNVEWKIAAGGISTSPVRLCLVKSLPGIHQFLRGADEGYFFYSMVGMNLARSMGLPSVIWFDRGLGHLIGYSRIDDNHVELGKSTIEERVPLRSKGFIPWDRFFKVTHTSPEFIKKDEIRRYDAQCSLFIRYLLTHPDRAWRDKLFRWLELVAATPPTEKAFKEIFEQDWAQWQQTMEEYLKKRERHMLTYDFAPGQVDTSSRSVDLKAVEMRELFLLAQTLSQNRQRMASLLDHLLNKGLRNDCLRPLLIAACTRHSRDQSALEQLRLIIKSGTQVPQIYEEASRILLRLRMPKPDLDTILTADDSEIRGFAQKALELEPGLAISRLMLVRSHAFVATPSREDLKIISDHIRGVGQHPIRFEMMAALAVAQVRAGEASEALETCERTLDESGENASSPLLRQLKARLELEAK